MWAINVCVWMKRYESHNICALRGESRLHFENQAENKEYYLLGWLHDWNRTIQVDFLYRLKEWVNKKPQMLPRGVSYLYKLFTSCVDKLWKSISNEQEWKMKKISFCYSSVLIWCVFWVKSICKFMKVSPI